MSLHGQEFKGTAKEILGTCFAVGCTVDGQKPIAKTSADQILLRESRVVQLAGLLYLCAVQALQEAIDNEES